MDADRIVETANRVLVLSESWDKLNALKINMNKTKAIVFKPRNKITNQSINLNLGLPPVSLQNKIKLVFIH